MPEKFLIINPENIDNWNKLILAHPEYSFFHTKEWLRVLSDTYGYKPIYFSKLNNNQLLSTIPIMLVKSIITGNRLVSLPFTDRCDPLPGHIESFEELKNEMIEFCKNNDIKSVEFRTLEKLFLFENYVQYNLNHLLYLNQSNENLFKSFSENTRRNIKKALKAGIHIERDNTENGLKIFYELQCNTRKKHGLPPQPIKFYKNILYHIINNNQGDIWLAKWENKIVAGAVYFHFGKKALFKFGASNTNYMPAGTNHLIMWTVIKEYNNNGYEELDLGRTEKDNEGLRRYKLGFNTVERTIYRVVLDVNNEKPIPSKIKVAGFHNKIFSRMPIGLLKIIGKITYKHIG